MSDDSNNNEPNSASQDTTKRDRYIYKGSVVWHLRRDRNGNQTKGWAAITTEVCTTGIEVRYLDENGLEGRQKGFVINDDVYLCTKEEA